MPGIVIDIGRYLRGLVYTSWARHVSNAGLRLRERGDGAGGAEEGGVPAEGGIGRQGRLEGRTQPGHQVGSDYDTLHHLLVLDLSTEKVKCRNQNNN